MTDRPIRVLFLNTHVAPSLGADVWVHARIMEGLPRDAHELSTACVPRTADGDTPTYCELSVIDDLDVIEVAPGPTRPRRGHPRDWVAAFAAIPATIGSVVRVVREVRRRRIDVIHSTDRPRDAVSAVVLARLLRIRSLVHVHVGYADWMSRPLRWAIAHADARIAVSEFVRRTLLDGGMPPESTFTVLNSIDVARWDPDTDPQTVRTELGIDLGAPVVTTICRLFAAKGPELLIEAVGRVAERHPDVHLLIVGEDHDPAQGYRRSLDELVDRLDLGERVTFTGRRGDVADVLAATDVFAMPSFLEPFGLVYAESMAMRVPVVALDNGGTTEVVDDGRTGVLVPPDDVVALADAISGLLDDPERRASLGAAGRARVDELFTIDRLASDVAAVYREVASDAADQASDSVRKVAE